MACLLLSRLPQRESCWEMLQRKSLTALLRFEKRKLSQIFHSQSGGKNVKRLLGLFLCLTMFSAAAAPALACRHHRRSHARYAYSNRQRYRRVAYNRSYYRPRQVYYAYPAKRSFWQRHRDALTLAIGTGGGAGVGALLGGKRGAGIGSLVGLGSSALYTYKLRDRRRY